MKLKILLIFVFLCLINLSTSTIGPSEKKPKKNKNKSKNADALEDDGKPADKSVVERNLIVEKDLNAQSIIDNNLKYCLPCATIKNFNNTVLGYVTPWNSHGYTIAKQFSNKFDYISPVWLQIKRLKYKSYSLSGTNDIDKLWMSDVKKNSNNNVGLIPRIMFENWSANDLHALFNDEDEMTELVKMLVQSANKYKFDGYVLEIYSQLHGFGKNHINHFVSDLANGLHSNKKKKILILVIPPAFKNESPGEKEKETEIVFNKNDFDLLKDVVDGFSLMTYDYAMNLGKIESNAPYEWVKRNVEYLTSDLKYRKKILLGLNFYGMKYLLELIKKRKPNGAEPIVGKSFVDLLKSYKVKIRYDYDSEEHIFYLLNFNDNVDNDLDVLNAIAIVYYPTLASIQIRIELAQELNTGISIWELGQGLDYFYDLF